MKKIDGFTLWWDLMVAFTTGLGSILSIPELVLLINKEHRDFIDGALIVLIVIGITMFLVMAVKAGALSAYNTIISVNKEELEEKQCML